MSGDPTAKVHNSQSEQDKSAEQKGEEEVESWGALPQKGTPAGIAFFKQHKFDLYFVSSETQTINELERIINSVAKAVLPHKEPRAGFPSLFHSLDHSKELNELNWEIRREVIITRYVDNYLTYLSHLLRIIFEKAYVSGDKLAFREFSIPVEELIEDVSVKYGDIEKLEEIADKFKWLLQKRVENLSREGFVSMAKFLKRNLKLSLIDDPARDKDIVQAVATRNLLVHKRGIVDGYFLDTLNNAKIDSSRMKLGDRLLISDYVYVMDIVWDSVKHLEMQTMELLGLDGELIDESKWNPHRNAEMLDSSKASERDLES